MSVAVLSLLALVVTVLISCFLPINVGVVAIVFAWLVGVYAGGLSVVDVMSGFPTQIFLTLAGVMLLFAQAEANGTLERVARLAVRLSRGNLGVIPVMFAGLGLFLATIGPGSIAVLALLAPIAMKVAGEVGIPAFLMALMVAHGTNAGSLSPLGPTGVVVTDVMARIGLPGREWTTFTYNVVAQLFVGFAGYALFGGLKLFRRSAPVAARASSQSEAGAALEAEPDVFLRRHWITIGVIIALVLGVIVFDLNVGMAAFAGSLVLSALGAANDTDAMRRMPWKVVVMVTGVTLLVALVEKTGGMSLFTALLARMATADTVTAVIAFVTGTVSVFSSTAGVVLPTFLPTVPGLVERLGDVDPFAIASSINVSSLLVDVSSLSTLGALCVAAAPPNEDSRALFNKLLAWGLSMAVVAAGLCYLAFGLG
jgi:Na+/H+ antiporter NhaD/arsenite permease-like protein